jgi:hypothetical protein
MTAKPYTLVAPWRAGDRGMYVRATVGDTTYFLGVERDKQVRIPYKPRGKNRGWTYYGFVRDAKGTTLWGGTVPKSTGARALLRAAGLIPQRAGAPLGVV